MEKHLLIPNQCQNIEFFSHQKVQKNSDSEIAKYCVMSQFDIKLDYLPSHMVSQELYHHQLIIYFISSAQCQDFIFHNALTLKNLHMFQSEGYYMAS